MLTDMERDSCKPFFSEDESDEHKARVREACKDVTEPYILLSMRANVLNTLQADAACACDAEHAAALYFMFEGRNGSRVLRACIDTGYADDQLCLPMADKIDSWDCRPWLRALLTQKQLVDACSWPVDMAPHNVRIVTRNKMAILVAMSAAHIRAVAKDSITFLLENRISCPLWETREACQAREDNKILLHALGGAVSSSYRGWRRLPDGVQRVLGIPGVCFPGIASTTCSISTSAVKRKLESPIEVEPCAPRKAPSIAQDATATFLFVEHIRMVAANVPKNKAAAVQFLLMNTTIKRFVTFLLQYDVHSATMELNVALWGTRTPSVEQMETSAATVQSILLTLLPA